MVTVHVCKCIKGGSPPPYSKKGTVPINLVLKEGEIFVAIDQLVVFVCFVGHPLGKKKVVYCRLSWLLPGCGWKAVCGGRGGVGVSVRE